jgi:thioredoxin reductase
MVDKINSMVPEVYAIGDCQEPSLIVDAIGTGLKTAISV